MNNQSCLGPLQTDVMDSQTDTTNALNTLDHNLAMVASGQMERLSGEDAAKPALKLNLRFTLAQASQKNQKMIIPGPLLTQFQFLFLTPQEKNALQLTTTQNVQNT